MYKHQIKPFGRFEKHELRNPSSGSGFSLAPAHGSCLLDLRFEGISILDGYQNAQELDINRWAKNVVLFPFANRLKDGVYEWDGEVYQLPINDLATHTALHGFGMDQPMEVEQLQLTQAGASIRCSLEYDGKNPGYPFRFTFSITFSIQEPNIFKVEMSISNEDDRRIPAGMGWHPYFRLSDKIDDLQLQLPPCEMVGVDERMIPTGKRYPYQHFNRLSRLGITVLDNCFAILEKGEPAKVVVEGEKGTINYWQETGKNRFNFLQIFTPPHRSSLAVEPMTGNIDAFNNGEGLISIEPEEQASASFGFSFQKG